MRVRFFLLLFGLLALVPASQARADTVEACREQAVIAERSAGIPVGLLQAIGVRESGRFDPQTGSMQPWPWSLNRDGQGMVFDTQAEAVAYVVAAQRGGSRSIDVGCFQINLKYHPGAFATLEEAFDPATNAAYAARFLSELHDRDGSWEAAVADYHSATAWFGEPYRDAVLAIWHGLPPSAATVMASGDGPTRVLMGIRIFEPTVRRIVDEPAARTGSPIRMAAYRGEIVPMIAPRRVNGLPRVITPTSVLAAR